MYLMTELIKIELDRRGYITRLLGEHNIYDFIAVNKLVGLNGQEYAYGNVIIYENEVMLQKRHPYCLEDPNFNPEKFFKKVLKDYPCIS